MQNVNDNTKAAPHCVRKRKHTKKNHKPNLRTKLLNNRIYLKWGVASFQHE